MTAGPARDGSVKVTMYKSGFTVGDGDLRRFDDPANAAFLRDIERGRVPEELVLARRAADGGARGGAGGVPEMDVELVDKRGEEYVPPAYRAFSGSGAAVGGGAAVPAAAVVGGAGARGAAAAVPVLDEAAPTATLQVRLADGRRERVVLNLSHTVGQLQARVATMGGTTRPFMLLAGVPPRPLADPSLTLEAAGLKSAAITQKEA